MALQYNFRPPKQNAKKIERHIEKRFAKGVFTILQRIKT